MICAFEFVKEASFSLGPLVCAGVRGLYLPCMLLLQTRGFRTMTSAIDVQQQWLCEAMLVSSDEETDEEATPLRLLPGSVSSYDRAVSVMGTPDRKQLHNLRQQLQSFLREGVPVHERSQRFSAGLPVWRPRLLWLSTSLNSLCLRRPSRPKPGLRAVKLGGSLAGRRPYKKIRLGALVDVRKVGDKGQLCCVTAHGEHSIAVP